MYLHNTLLDTIHCHSPDANILGASLSSLQWRLGIVISTDTTQASACFVLTFDLEINSSGQKEGNTAERTLHHHHCSEQKAMRSRITLLSSISPPYALVVGSRLEYAYHECAEIPQSSERTQETMEVWVCIYCRSSDETFPTPSPHVSMFLVSSDPASSRTLRRNAVLKVSSIALKSKRLLWTISRQELRSSARHLTQRLGHERAIILLL